MRQVFYLLLLFCIVDTIPCISQVMLDRTKLPKTVYFYDDFTDNRNRWSLNDHSNARSSIRNGKFYFENKLTEKTYSRWDSYGIDPTRNYYIEMVLAITKGGDGQGTGILFNHTTSKKENVYEFKISSNQYFCIYKKIEGESQPVIDWTKCNSLNKTGNNTLGIFAKGSDMLFFINDYLVYEMTRPEFLGNDIGMVVSEATEMAIDEFTIRFNPLLINKVADTTMVYKKVGAAINSALDDSYPILSADGKLMFFSRTTNRGSIGIEASTLMYSEFNDSIKEWSQAKSLPKEINQGIGNPQVIYISADKNTLIVNASYDDNGRYIKPEGVSVFYRNKQGWSAPEKIIIEEFENRSKREAYAFSANNQIMILSVQTKNGYGERDLYVSFKKKDRWTKPKNLGQVVNSVSNDYSPCLAPDNVTLYYSSSGKPGYGKSDIFMTRRLDDTWLNWSEPKNLGPDINSPLHDSGLQVDAHGQYAYMNDYSNEIQKGEICRIKIPESAKPKPVVIVKGKVYDKLTNEPFPASIIYENLEKNIREGMATSSPEDGSYTLVLPYGINYGLLASAKGYLSESKNIDIRDSLINGFIEMKIDLYLTPLNVEQTLILNTIFFEEDKFELKETSLPELNRLYEIMLENSHMMLEIAGHTDFGTVSANEQELLILSTKRAEAVKKILVSKGILETRITVVGYGRSRPIISGNDSRNRRVEVKILKL